MRKNTKSKVVSNGQKRLLAEPGKKPKPARGRPKSKTQISVRIDEERMQQAYAHMNRTGLRLTDMLERGLQMVLEAEGEARPTNVIHPRYLISHISEEDGRYFKDLLYWNHYPEYSGRPLSYLEILVRQQLLETLKLARGSQDYETVMRGIMGMPDITSSPQIGT